MANITVSAKKVREFQAIKGSERGKYDAKAKTYSSHFEYSVNLRFNAKANRFTVRVSNIYIYAEKAKDGSIKLVLNDSIGTSTYTNIDTTLNNWYDSNIKGTDYEKGI